VVPGVVLLGAGQVVVVVVVAASDLSVGGQVAPDDDVVGDAVRLTDPADSHFFKNETKNIFYK
jgi:hypothetical protein